MKDNEDLKEIIKEAIEDIFFSEEEYAPFNSLMDKVNKLLMVSKHEVRLDSAVKYADKFEDYMKNVDKLNQMINEFKGLVAIVRGETAQVKKQNQTYKKKIKQLLEILSDE